MARLTLPDVDAIAVQAHAGQLDKIGVPYINHVRAVAAGLAPFGVGMQMAGLLHDVIEDTSVTADHLVDAGVPVAVVNTVRRVTNRPGFSYGAMLLGISGDYSATLLKISDNAHNSHPDRATQLPEEKRARLAEKYRHARSVLWPAVPYDDVRAILAIVNPALLSELAEAACTHRGLDVDVWFDRTICPDPCGTMHQRCTACGAATDGCAWDFDIPARPTTDAEFAALPILDMGAFRREEEL